MKKVYLGDGVYAQCDGYYIELTTEDGVSVLQRIYLNPDVYQALILYHDSLGTDSVKGSGQAQAGKTP